MHMEKHPKPSQPTSTPESETPLAERSKEEKEEILDRLAANVRRARKARDFLRSKPPDK